MAIVHSTMFCALLAICAAVSAQPMEQKIHVDGAWVRRAPMLASGDGKAGTGTGAAYAKLVNSGKEPDTLIAAESDVAEAVEIHESYQDSGMMKMRQVERIDVPPGQTVEMKPGGYHVMFLKLRRDLKPGEVVKLTLQFKNAGKIPVSAAIR